MAAYTSPSLPPFFDAGAAAADRTRAPRHNASQALVARLRQGRPGFAGWWWRRRRLPSACHLFGQSRSLRRQAQQPALGVRLSNQARRGGGTLAAELGGDLRELNERGERHVGQARDADELRAALLQRRRSDAAEFAADLGRFVRALLEASAPKLWTLWRETLSRFELTPPPGTHLILSVPGRYSHQRYASLEERGFEAGWAGDCRPSPAGKPPRVSELYGHLALSRHLSRRSRRALRRSDPPASSTHAAPRAARGHHEPLLACPQAKRGVMEGLCARARTGWREGAFITGISPSAKGQAEPLVRLVWPSLTTSLAAFELGKGLLTIGGGKNTMTGPSDAKCKELKSSMAHNYVSSARRRGTLHHIKMAAGIIAEAAPRKCEEPLRSWRGAQGAEEPPRAPLLAWLYAGSHNFSAAAWGKLEPVDDDAIDGGARRGGGGGTGEDNGHSGSFSSDDDEFGEEPTELVCMSYELGVLLIPPKPRRMALPWQSPAPKYDPTDVRPFSTSRYLSLLRASRFCHDPAREERAGIGAADTMRRLWKRLTGGERSLGQGRELSLPTLLPFDISLARKLVLVEVTRDHSVVLCASPPTPQSEQRKQVRHLKRGWQRTSCSAVAARVSSHCRRGRRSAPCASAIIRTATAR